MIWLRSIAATLIVIFSVLGQSNAWHQHFSSFATKALLARKSAVSYSRRMDTEVKDAFFAKSTPFAFRGLMTRLKAEPAAATSAGTKATPTSSIKTSSYKKAKAEIKAETEAAKKSKKIEEIEKRWKLILYDDNVHTIQEVTDTIETAIPMCRGERSNTLVLQVHNYGQAVLCASNKKLISEYLQALQSAGLTVSMEPIEPKKKSSDGTGGGDGGSSGDGGGGNDSTGNGNSGSGN